MRVFQFSFDRCESESTDGFCQCRDISQFCSGLNGRLERVPLRRRWDIQDAGGKSEFWGLYEGDRRVKAKQGRGQFRSHWLLHEDETALIAARGKVFLPTGSRSRVLKQLGLRPAEWNRAGRGSLRRRRHRAGLAA